MATPPTTDDFREEIRRQFSNACHANQTHIDINAGQLHRAVGGYPGPSHAMPSCCNAMREASRPGDDVLEEPPKGKGASLTIRYRLPR